MYNQPFMKCNK